MSSTAGHDDHSGTGEHVQMIGDSIGGDLILDPFSALTEFTTDLVGQAEASEAAERTLCDVAEAAKSAGRYSTAHGAELLAKLCQILAVSEDSQADYVIDIASFIGRGVSLLRDALDEDSAAERKVESMVEDALQRWGELLELVDGADYDRPSVTDWSEDSASDEDDIAAPSEEELSLILSALTANAVEGEDGAASSDEPLPDARQTAPETFASVSPDEFPSLPATAESPPSLEGELLDAYLDDAGRCLAGIESSALEFAQQPNNAQPLQQVCRELHTLKGASASVGLNVLAGYLHNVEEFIETRCDGQGIVEADALLATVDVIRNHIAGLQAPVAGAVTNNAPNTAARGDESAHGAEETVRVKASQLDRLMDMLAELVMLRNRRESSISELQHLNDELIRCATRLRFEGDEFSSAAHTRGNTNPMREVANDVLEISRTQREICDQVAGENLAVTRFIRNFRQELTEVRRLPISGLFRRLQRAVHDAAAIEGKQVRLEFVGEHAGLERSLQERLYEPLLHIVRNSVSHGIESESTRVAGGKDACGTVTLEARGASNLLILEVRDDGQGLDYDALRRRGIERGILPADQPATREELAQLIFHPGFSTRESANAVAGRGVGMDVVAESLNKMRAWIEVESTPGNGTKIRLSIPLRSVIEHTMVFRCGGQLFAVPMQFVRNASHDGASDKQDPSTTVCYSDLFGQTRSTEKPPMQRLTLGYGRKVHGSPDANAAAPNTSGRQFAMLVDEIVGPEEVVVRPLPPLLRHQSLVSGVTLSGTGELLLLLDSQRLVEIGLHGQVTPDSLTQSPRLPSRRSSRVLVVDDSISARRCLVRAVRQFGLEPVEAADGQEALGLISQGDFAAVFSDLEMPRLGGLDLVREIGSQFGESATPVTIVSSRSEEEYKTQAEQLGAVAYLTKPVTEARVGEVLQRLGLLTASQTGGEVH